MKIISFYNQKGGTGKSTICCETAYVLSKNKKVLVIDLDAQCNSTNLICGHIPNKGIYDLLTDETDSLKIHDFLTPGKGIWSDLIVLASSKRLDTALPILQNRMNRDFILKQIIDQAIGFVDYVLIDYPPQLNLLTVNGLAASSGYVLVQQAEEWSLDGARTIKDLAEKVRKNLNKNLKFYGVIINLLKKDNSLYVKSMLHEIEKEWKKEIFKSKIADSVVVGEAKKQKQPITAYASSHKVSKQLLEFVKELTKKLGEKNGK